MDTIWYLLLLVFMIETAFIMGGLYSILKFRLRKRLSLTWGRILTDVSYVLYSVWMVDAFVNILSDETGHHVSQVGFAVLIQCVAALAIYYRVQEFSNGNVHRI